MKRNLRKCYNELKKIGAPVFERYDPPDGFLLSAESNYDRIWADYWNEFGVEVDPKVEEICSRNKVFLEWENPGCLIAYDNSF